MIDDRLKDVWEGLYDMQADLIAAVAELTGGGRTVRGLLSAQLQNDAATQEISRIRLSGQLWMTMQMWHCADQFAKEWAAVNLAASGGEEGAP